jgi:hypothetical protein
LGFEIVGVLRSDRASSMESAAKSTGGTTAAKKLHLVDGML